MSSLDPEQVGVLSNAGGFLLQADEAGQAAVTVVLRSLQDLERLVKEASAQDVRDGYDLPCLHLLARDSIRAAAPAGHQLLSSHSGVCSRGWACPVLLLCLSGTSFLSTVRSS